MTKKIKIVGLLALLAASSAINAQNKKAINRPPAGITTATGSLGAFSMSLNVKDLAVSKAFYEKLGFRASGGSMEQRYLIMKNGNALVGLFQGMFEGNILTFNPGWDEDAKNLPSYKDIRLIQKQLKAGGLELISEADENTKGPASIMLKDPDGNLILLDQHH